MYPNAEVEPSVATNRFLPFEVVGAWQQDRWNDGGARGLVAGFSRDGGRTFRRSVWPVSRCAPGGLNYERASDPWVSIGPEGTVYGSALPFDVNSPRNTVAALTSYDGGRTWRNVTVLIDDTEAAVLQRQEQCHRRPGPARLGLPGMGPAGVQPGRPSLSTARRTCRSPATSAAPGARRA